MIGQPIADLEKVTEVPSESTYIVGMGDGSGTKAVTQETLTKEVGKGLKVGNLAELQTENKNNLVAAINEAAQSGGGGAAVDILDTKEEIEANTESGKAAGAQAVKEMLSEINDKFGYDTKLIDGVPHWSPRGADTWSPFSSGGISGCTLLCRKLSTSQEGTYTRILNSDYEFVLCRWRSYNKLPDNLEQIFLANSSLFSGGETTYVAIYKLKVGESISMSNFGEIWGIDF